MYNFFVLGQIPGTDITITFTMWLEIGAALLLLIALITMIWRRVNRYTPMPPTIAADNLNSLNDQAA